MMEPVRLGVAFLVCLSGCSELFGLDEVTPPPPPDAAPDARLPVMGCTPASLLHEEFDDPGGTPWFPTISGTGTALLVGGALQIVISATDAYFTVSSERFYDMRDDQFTFELTETGLDADSSIEVRIDADPEEKSWLQFFRTGTKLHLRRANLNGIVMELAMFDYVPADHRFLRFKHSGTQVIFQTSGNGTDYTDRLTAFDVTWGATVRPEVVFHRGTGATMFQASLHSVHGGSSAVGACPIRELVETFDGNVITPLWKRTTAYDGTLTQSNGALEVANTPSMNLSATIRPLGLYDLRNASVTIDIEQMFETTQGMWFELGFRGIGGRAEIMRQEMGVLSIEHYDGSVVATKPYVAADARFWRFTEALGKITWATSGDGVTFAPFSETTGHVGLERADVFLSGNGTSSVQTSIRIASVIGADAP